MTIRTHLPVSTSRQPRGSARLTARLALGGILLVVASVALAPVVGASPSRTTTDYVARSIAGFAPVAASFVDAQHGWVLGQAGCPSCLALRVTSDGGLKWEKLPNPSEPFFWGYNQLENVPVLSTVTDIRFANLSTGFLFDPGFEVTHDGGHSWNSGGLSNVLQVVTADGYVYALTQAPSGPVVVWSSTIASTHWTRLALPTSGEIWGHDNGVGDGTQLAASKSQVLYLLTGTGKSAASLFVSDNFGRSFAAHPVPCAPLPDTTSGTPNQALVATIVNGEPDHWVVYCLMRKWDASTTSYVLASQLFMTSDAGLRWTPFGASLTTPALATVAFPNVLTAGGPSEVLLAGRTENGVDSLTATVDAGRSWSRVIEDGGSSDGWIDLDYVSPSTVFIVGPTHDSPQHLYRSRDGGKRWCVMLEEPNPVLSSSPPSCS